MRKRTNEASLCLAASMLGVILSTSNGFGQTPVERGAYLADAIMGCDRCHTPRGPNGLDMSRRFSGGSQTWDEPTYTVKGTNITQDRETGIGAWSDADIKRALTHGVRPNGVPIAPIMPFGFSKVLTPGDQDALVAFLRTIPPVRNQVQTPVYKAEMPKVVVPGGEQPMTAEQLKDPLQRGFYLANLAHCMECHGRKADGSHDLQNGLGVGGYVMKGPFGSVSVSNITAHKTAGIGDWSTEEVKRALTAAVGRDGRPFKPPMARADLYSRMTPTDLDDLVRYVRSLPAKE